MPAPVNPKYAAFCREYMIDRCGARAAERVGYSPRHSKQTAHELLQREDVQSYLAELAAAYLAEVQQDAVSVLRLVVTQANTGLGDFVRIREDGEPVIDLSRATKEQLDTLQEITVETFMDGGDEDSREVRRIKLKAGDRHKPIDRLWEYTKLAAIHAETQANALASAIDQLARVRGSSMPVSRETDDEGDA